MSHSSPDKTEVSYGRLRNLLKGEFKSLFSNADCNSNALPETLQRGSFTEFDLSALGGCLG